MVRRVLLLSVAFVWTGQAIAAEEFVSREHGFKITFPRAPTAHGSEGRTTSGLTRIVRYAAKHKAFRTSLSVVTYSRGDFTAEEIKVALGHSRDRQLSRPNSELISEKDVAIDGHPGKELVIAVGPPGKPRNYRYRARNYYVDHRQYLMSVIGTKKLVFSQRSDDFFNSFALIKPGDVPSK